MSSQFRHVTCRDCQQPIIQRGRTRLNQRGTTPLNHDLTCTAKTQAPDAQDGASVNKETA